MSAFDPMAFPQLVALSQDLRQLAGDAAFRAGQEYRRKGLVAQGAVGGTTAYATVSGSTDYRVSISFGSDVKVTCTCPAHRRSKFCKHVVAVCAALLDEPASFAEVEAPPEAPPSDRPRARRAPKRAGPSREELRTAGLATVDKLIEDLAADGLLGLGPGKLELLNSAAELVRGLKLRRLGNLVFALQRAANAQGQQLEPAAFADLLIDLTITQRASTAHLTGQVELDPVVADDLIGKTWRAEELEPLATSVEALELAFTAESDGEFRIETSYLAEIDTGTILADRQITPLRIRSAPKSRYRARVILEDARLYPGLAPRRIRIGRARPAELTAEHVDRLVARAETSVAALRRRVAEREGQPFGAPPVAALFAPEMLLERNGELGAVDVDAELIRLIWPPHSRAELLRLLPTDQPYALFGHVDSSQDGLEMRCLSAISSGLSWGRGPIFPDG
jgi:hypothetical protein